MALIEIGARAPRFVLADQHGEFHDFKDFAGRIVVLYFYPKDDTSGCTAEACQFRDHHPDFSKLKGTVVGISPDDVVSHGKFDRKHALGFTLLADPPGPDGTPRTCDAYGVWSKKSMYGRSYMGVVRTTYLIGPDGRVAARWDRVQVPAHAAEVLAAARALHSGVDVKAAKGEAKRGKLKGGSKVSRVERLKTHRSSRTTRSKDSDPPFKPVRGLRSAGIT